MANAVRQAADIAQQICRYFAGKNQATGIRCRYAYDHLW